MGSFFIREIYLPLTVLAFSDSDSHGRQRPLGKGSPITKKEPLQFALQILEVLITNTFPLLPKVLSVVNCRSPSVENFNLPE